jgi:hypothetical protein
MTICPGKGATYVEGEVSAYNRFRIFLLPCGSGDRQVVPPLWVPPAKPLIGPSAIESIRDRNQRRGGIIRPGTGIQMVDGRVEQVHFQRSSFEYAISPERGSWFLFLTMLGGRMSIISGRFGLAITSGSRGDSSIGNASSWRIFYGTIGSRFIIGVA